MLYEFGKSFAFIIPDIRAQKHKHAFKKHLFIIYQRFQIYSHLPHQVANNGIKGYDTKLSKYPKIWEHKHAFLHIVNNSVLFTSYFLIFLLVVVFVFSHSSIPV